MDLLIIVKWNTNYVGATSQAPSIIVTIVNFFLNSGEIKGREFFPANQFVSQILLRKCIRKSTANQRSTVDSAACTSHSD